MGRASNCWDGTSRLTSPGPRCIDRLYRREAEYGALLPFVSGLGGRGQACQVPCCCPRPLYPSHALVRANSTCLVRSLGRAMFSDQAGPQTDSSKGVQQESSPVRAPSVSLPKGGGAIRGMGEKFGANPVTGTGNL